MPYASDELPAAPRELKASLIDDNHFRVLAIPFGGPLKGRDLDGDYFTRD